MELKQQERPVAIQITGVKKRYRLGQIGGRTLQGDLQSWWAKVRGREDPNTRIGQEQRLVGQSFMALNGIDLTVYQGERLGIIGSNGAGKSTLLKLLCRITAPTEGDIDLYGRVTSMLEVGTGFHGEMTGRENVYLNGAFLGMTRAEIDEKMEEIIEFSEVRDFIDTPVKRYSSGMFVKLAFSVAAHLNSEIMIMDEVLAVGDVAFQKKCLDKMREAAAQEGRTVLYVSHNMSTIRQLCERCVVLQQGRIIYDGDVETAIGIYMNSGLEETGVDFDLTDKSFGSRGLDLALAMEYLTLMDALTPAYRSGDTLKLRFRVRTGKPLRDVFLRMTLRTDGDAVLGTAWSEPVDLPEPGVREILYTFPLDALAQGSVYASVGFYRRSEAGQYLMLDAVQRAFRLDILPGQNPRPWNTRAMGVVRFADMRAELLP